MLIVHTFGLWRLQLSIVTGKQTERSNMTKNLRLERFSVWVCWVGLFLSCYLCHRVLRSSSVLPKNLYRDFLLFLTVGKATAAPCSTGSPSVTVSLNTVRWKCLLLCFYISSVHTSAVSVISRQFKTEIMLQHRGRCPPSGHILFINICSDCCLLCLELCIVCWGFFFYLCSKEMEALAWDSHTWVWITREWISEFQLWIQALPHRV